jgi:hypothetical protein
LVQITVNKARCISSNVIKRWNEKDDNEYEVIMQMEVCINNEHQSDKSEGKESPKLADCIELMKILTDIQLVLKRAGARMLTVEPTFKI